MVVGVVVVAVVVVIIVVVDGVVVGAGGGGGGETKDQRPGNRCQKGKEGDGLPPCGKTK